MSDQKYESWAIVEVMGHKRFAGFVSEQTIAGTAFVRVDVPETTHVHRDVNWETRQETVTAQIKPGYTKMIGAGSIYCITPTTEEIARAAAHEIERYNDPLPVQLPKALPASTSSTEFVEEEPDDYGSDEDDCIHPECDEVAPDGDTTCKLDLGHFGNHSGQNSEGNHVEWENEDEDDGCPVNDPDCEGRADQCHDACEAPEAAK